MNSIEWLIEELTPSIALQQKYIDKLKEQAQAMHEKEMTEACRKMQIVMDVDFDGDVTFMFSPEDYYKKNYKK
jgi:hypothetical protein